MANSPNYLLRGHDNSPLQVVPPVSQPAATRDAPGRRPKVAQGGTDIAPPLESGVGGQETETTAALPMGQPGRRQRNHPHKHASSADFNGSDLLFLLESSIF
jgi:hypothetical protein